MIMVWDTCNIVVNSAESNFYSNNIVTGTVTLGFKSKKKLKDIILVVKGTSKASWSRPAPTIPYIRIYSEKKNVFELIIHLFKELQGQTVKPGVITCPFHFILPPELPSSYKDSVVKVHYRIILKSKTFCNSLLKTEIPLTVLNCVNVNHLQGYKKPTIYDITKIFRKSDEVLIFFRTYKAFAPKQCIPFEAIISNEKKVWLTKITVTLIQKLQYTITSGFHNVEKDICKSEYLDVKNVARQICLFDMNIPTVIPSTINENNHMVKCSYSLVVKISFRFHLPLYSDIPVVLATVPIKYDTF